MKSSAKKIELASVDDLFSTEEGRQDAKLEKIQEIPLSELHPFKNHPFKVKDDEAMMQDVNHQLFTESVLEEVLLSMPGKDSDESPENVAKAEAILTEMDLLPYKACHPMGLSGGQKQRVAIASAIASERPVILFDEPTSGLDLFHMRQVADSVKGLADSGKTIVIVTHDPEFILRCCNYVIHLENGRLEENYFLQDTEGRERLFNFFMMEGGGGNQTV